jgi:hypothetical protein
VELIDKYLTQWDYSEKNENHVKITTETRIHCTSKSAKRKFIVYWLFISFLVESSDKKC